MPLKRHYLHMKNEEGSGLVLALMTLLVLSVLGASLGAVTIGSVKLGNVNRDDTSAYYIAEAGANMAYEEFKAGVEKAYSDFPNSEGSFYNAIENKTNATSVINKVRNKDYNVFEKQSGENPTVNISISKTEGANPRYYTILSTGDVAGKTRTVEKKAEVNWVKKEAPAAIEFPSIPNNTPVIVGRSLSLTNTPGIDGHILHDLSSSINIDKNKVNHNNGSVKKNKDSWTVYERFIDTFPSEPAYAQTATISNNMTITENTYISDFSTKATTTIDTKGNDIAIIVDNFKLNKNHHLKATGNGKIFFYIKNNFKMEQDSKIEGQSNQINLLYAGASKFQMTNLNNETKGSLFIKQADIELGQNSKIKGGYLISGGEKVSLHQNFNFDDGIMLVPNGTVYFKGTLNGTVIAKHLSLTGGNYNKKNLNIDYPFSSISNNQSSGEEGVSPSLISSEPAIEHN